MKVYARAPVASTAVLTVLVGCGQSSNTPESSFADSKPDVTVTFDAQRHKCVVALSKEAQGSTVPCAEVVAFVEEELRLPQGSVYALRTPAGADAAEVATIRAALNGAGYRFIEDKK